jgi:hypothetical protein
MKATAPAPPPAPLSPFLEHALGELRAIRADAAALTGGLSPAQLAWSPEPGRWSIAEVAAHLNLAGRIYLDAIAHTLAEARARGLADRGDYRPTLTGRFMAWALSPDQRVKMKAPAIFRRAEGTAAIDGPRELANWRALHVEVEERIREAAGVDLRRARFVSPASRLVRMNLGDAFSVLLVHERRHLLQLRNLRSHPGFPA